LEERSSLVVLAGVKTRKQRAAVLSWLREELSGRAKKKTASEPQRKRRLRADRAAIKATLCPVFKARREFLALARVVHVFLVVSFFILFMFLVSSLGGLERRAEQRKLIRNSSAFSLI